MDYYLVNLVNSTKHQSARLIFSFSVVTVELGTSAVIHILSQLIISGLVDNGLNWFDCCSFYHLLAYT